MTRAQRTWLVAAGVYLASACAAFILKGAWERSLIEQGRAVERANAAAVAAKPIVQKLDSARAQVIRDTVRVTRTVDRWRTVVDSLAPDTVTVSDTVRVLVQAGNQNAAAALACVESCGAYRTWAERRIENLQLQLDAELGRRPSRWRTIGEKVLWGAAGYGVGRLMR